MEFLLFLREITRRVEDNIRKTKINLLFRFNFYQFFSVSSLKA